MAKRAQRSKKTAQTTGEKTLEVPPTRSRPLVFISHDSRNADLAEAFGNLLSDVSGGTLKSFRSSDRKGTSGIEFGAEWFKTIMAQLSDATNVVALLTTQSMDRPWILYETGVAKGKLNTVVFGLALGVPLEKASTGPFGQFQNCGDDEDSLTKLVMQLLKQNPDAEPREEAVRTQVKLFIDGVAKILAAAPLAKAPKTDEQSIAKLFEEVKAMVRDIPEQLDARNEAERDHDGRREPRFHPRLIEELLFRMTRHTKTQLPTAFLAAVSVFRDECPWLIELAREVINAWRSADRERFDAARESFMEALEYIARGELGYRLLGGEGHRMFGDIVSMFHHFIYEGPFSKPQSRRLVKEHRGLINSPTGSAEIGTE